MYDREEMRKKLRDMLRSIGIDVPDQLPNWEIVVEDENGNIIKRRRIGESEKDDNNV